jgi:hypothetical protein
VLETAKGVTPCPEKGTESALLARLDAPAFVMLSKQKVRLTHENSSSSE